MQVRRHDSRQPLRRARAVDHVGDQVIERSRSFTRFEHGRQQRPQRERVRTARHETGPVRGVLHGVAEQQGLALRRLELPAGEQLGDGHGQEAGQPGTKEPGPFVHLTGRAPVALG